MKESERRDWGLKENRKGIRENGTSRITQLARALVAGLSLRQLAADRREHALDLIAQGDQDRDGDHGNEGENQGVLHESLAFLALHPAQCAFGANNYLVDHCLFTSSQKKIR